MAKIRLPSQDRERRFKCARNEAHVNEMRDGPHLHSHLCRTITGPPWTGFGPHPLPYSDRLYSIVLTEYYTHSIRRSEPHYEAAYEKGHISRAPVFNSVIDYYNVAETTSHLQKLISLSSAPLAEFETAILLDGTHLAMEEKLPYFDTHTANKANGHRYLMAQLAGGSNSHIITAAEVDIWLDKYFRPRHDNHFTELLLRTAANGFVINEVWGDKGYHSKKNTRLINSIGADYMVIERSGKKVVPPTGNSPLCGCEECFKRNQIESINSMIKQIMGDKVFNKNYISLENEVLGRVVAHNLRVLQQAIIAMDLEVDFYEIELLDKLRKNVGSQQRLPLKSVEEDAQKGTVKTEKKLSIWKLL